MLNSGGSTLGARRGTHKPGKRRRKARTSSEARQIRAVDERAAMPEETQPQQPTIARRPVPVVRSRSFASWNPQHTAQSAIYGFHSMKKRYREFIDKRKFTEIPP